MWFKKHRSAYWIWGRSVGHMWCNAHQKLKPKWNVSIWCVNLNWLTVWRHCTNCVQISFPTKDRGAVCPARTGKGKDTFEGYMWMGLPFGTGLVKMLWCNTSSQGCSLRIWTQLVTVLSCCLSTAHFCKCFMHHWDENMLELFNTHCGWIHIRISIYHYIY